MVGLKLIHVSNKGHWSKRSYEVHESNIILEKYVKL